MLTPLAGASATTEAPTTTVAPPTTVIDGLVFAVFAGVVISDAVIFVAVPELFVVLRQTS
mgnify:CR=1 FL=1